MISDDKTASTILNEGFSREVEKPALEIELSRSALRREIGGLGVLVGMAVVADLPWTKTRRDKLRHKMLTRFGLSAKHDHPKRMLLVRRRRAQSQLPELTITTSKEGETFKFDVRYKGGRSVVSAGGYRSRSTARRRGLALSGCLLAR